MKNFAAFVKKEFHHIFRDTRTMLILLGIPIILIILFGFAISTELRNVNIAIVVPNQCESVRKICEKINANEYFTITQQLNSPDKIDTEIKNGNIEAAVVFGPDFEKNPTMQLIIDASDPNSAVTKRMYLTGIIQNSITENTNSTISQQAIIPNIRMLYNPQMKSSYNFVPGIMGLIFILVCALMTSVSIVREKETGTMEVLLVSPVKPINIIFAKMIPYLALSCVNMLTILVLSFYVLGVPIAGSMFWIIIVSIIYIILSLSLGLLVSTLVDTQIAAMLGSLIILMLPVMLLSGMLFPIESMPTILQWISNIVPARWFISAMRKLMIEGLSASYVLKEIIILVAMTILIVTISLKNFKNRLE